MTADELKDLWHRLTEWMRCTDHSTNKWAHICETRRLVEVELWNEHKERPDEL